MRMKRQLSKPQGAHLFTVPFRENVEKWTRRENFFHPAWGTGLAVVMVVVGVVGVVLVVMIVMIERSQNS